MSLRARLLLAVGAVALLALVGAEIATYSATRAFLYERVDQQLEAAHPMIEQALNSGEQLTVATVGRYAPGLYVAERTPSGKFIAVVPAFGAGGESSSPEVPEHVSVPGGKDVDPDASAAAATTSTAPGTTTTQPQGAPGGGGAPGGAGGPSTPGAGGTSPAGGTGGRGEPATYLTVGSQTPGGPQYRLRVSTLDNGNQLVVGIPLEDTTETLHRLFLIELAVAGAALLASILLGWWLVWVGMRPLTQVTRTADAIADGDLDRRVPERNPKTEVGHLAHSFNAMVGRIQDAFAERDETEDELRASEDRMRRFVADASHELRTPLAAVSGYAELFERGASERPEDLPRLAKGIRTEAARMQVLVNDLLLLAHLDEGRPLELRPVELVGLAAEAVQAARAASADWPVRIEAARPVETLGDALRLRQVIDNLLANVRSHTPPGTEAVVRVSESSGWAVIEVEDHGPGLSPEAASRVFERFFRADASRNRESGGAGLGLAIVAGIVRAHRGHVAVEAAPSGGALFKVSLPLSGDDDSQVALSEPS